jgi:hypothetical protein
MENPMSTTETLVPVTSPAAFWDELNRADWYYNYSDDHRVWQSGSDAFAKLEAKAKKSPELQALYDGFKAHHFSGKPWGNEQAPKPERPAS